LEYTALYIPSPIGNDDMQSLTMSYFSPARAKNDPRSDEVQDLFEKLLEENTNEHGFLSSRFTHIM
jgi:hypothetical protein